MEQRHERGNETRPAVLETPVYRSALEQNFQRRVLKWKTEKQKKGDSAKTKEKRGRRFDKDKKGKEIRVLYLSFAMLRRNAVLRIYGWPWKTFEGARGGKGGKYTRSRLPVRLVYREEFATKNEAMSREYFIKRMPRSKKLALIEEYERKK